MNIEPHLEDRLKVVLTETGVPLSVYATLDNVEHTPNNVLIEATVEEEHVYRSGIYRATVVFTIRTNPDTMGRVESVAARARTLDVLAGITPDELTGGNVRVLKWKLISNSRSKDGDVDVSTVAFETLASMTAVDTP